MNKALLSCLALSALTQMATAALNAPYFFPDGDYPTVGFQAPAAAGNWTFSFNSNPAGAMSHLFVGPAAGGADNIAFEIFQVPPVDPTLSVLITTTAQQTGNFGFFAMPLFNSYVNLAFVVNGSPTPISLASMNFHQFSVSSGDLIGFQFTSGAGIPSQSQVTLGNIGFVPEPSAWALLAGLACLGALRFRRGV